VMKAAWQGVPNRRLMKAMIYPRRLWVLFVLVLGTSCASNPFQRSYEASPVTAASRPGNPSPFVQEVAANEHEAAVRSHLARGARLLGFSEVFSERQISTEQARLFALGRKADLAVYSRQVVGHTRRHQAVPVVSEVIDRTTAAGGGALSRRTEVRYQEDRAAVWAHRLSLLSGPARPPQPAAAPPSPADPRAGGEKRVGPPITLTARQGSPLGAGAARAAAESPRAPLRAGEVQAAPTKVVPTKVVPTKVVPTKVAPTKVVPRPRETPATNVTLRTSGEVLELRPKISGD